MANEKTLVDFLRDKKREDCPVCKLSDGIRDQLAAARGKKITRKNQLEWLRDVVSAEITNRDLDGHYQGRHDEP